MPSGRLFNIPLTSPSHIELLRESDMTQPSPQPIRFKGCSLPVLALEPEAPIADWIMRLDEYLNRFPVSFARKPIVIDVSKLGLQRSSVVALMESLSERGIRTLGLIGVEPFMGVRRPAADPGRRPCFGDR